MHAGLWCGCLYQGENNKLNALKQLEYMAKLSNHNTGILWLHRSTMVTLKYHGYTGVPWLHWRTKVTKGYHGYTEVPWLHTMATLKFHGYTGIPWVTRGVPWFKWSIMVKQEFHWAPWRGWQGCAYSVRGQYCWPQLHHSATQSAQVTYTCITMSSPLVCRTYMISRYLADTQALACSSLGGAVVHSAAGSWHHNSHIPQIHHNSTHWGAITCH